MRDFTKFSDTILVNFLTALGCVVYALLRLQLAYSKLQQLPKRMLFICIETAAAGAARGEFFSLCPHTMGSYGGLGYLTRCHLLQYLGSANL